jgi:energy-coupling factor transporter ATP-binding protein EcfA2
LVLVDVIELAGLRKHYRRLRGGNQAAVDGLDLAVPEGGVFGFLGPNGAGKTTTIRCLLGLVAPTAGSCRLLGADVGRDLPRVLGRVGSSSGAGLLRMAAPDRLSRCWPGSWGPAFVGQLRHRAERPGRLERYVMLGGHRPCTPVDRAPN